LAEAIVQRWRERVLDDVRARPFTDEEATRARAPLDRDPLISYGCTLLLAILTPSWVGLLQIGDGDVTVVRGGLVESPVPDDDRLVGGETTSLCLPTAVADARVHVIAEPLPDALILTTDGYANSFADANWRTHAGIDLRDQIHRVGLDAVETRLPAWLAESASAGGDDVSMALIQRLDVPPPVAIAPVSARSAAAPAPAAPATAGIGRGALVAAVAAAIVIGAGVGWVVGRSGGTTTAAATTIASEPTVPADTTVAPTTSTTTTSTTSTSTTTTTTTVPALASPNEQPLLFTGDNKAMVLMFDPAQGAPIRAVLLQSFTGPATAAHLPNDWNFDNGNLTRKRDNPITASAVAANDNYVWAVDEGGTQLSTYNARTGVQIGQTVPIDGVPANNNTPPSDAKTADQATTPLNNTSQTPTNT
jgi:hypothetical protein